MITIGDNKVIEAKIIDKSKAKKKYDEAMAAGKAPAMHMEDQGYHQVDIGTLVPGQQVKVEMHLIQQLSIKDGAYYFEMPLKYFPKYVES